MHSTETLPFPQGAELMGNFASPQGAEHRVSLSWLTREENAVFNLAAQPSQTGKKTKETKNQTNTTPTKKTQHKTKKERSSLKATQPTTDRAGLIFKELYLSPVICHELIRGIRNGPNGAQKSQSLVLFSHWFHDPSVFNLQLKCLFTKNLPA